MSLSAGLKITTYFAPEDDTEKTFLEFIKGTTKHLRIAVYGLHLPPLIDDLISLHQNGVDVALVCDHTQAEGKYEHPEIVQLVNAGIPLAVGTSTKHHIMHHKFAVRDQESVLAGSWNFSLSASKESNYFDIVESPERAALFLEKWQSMYEWILQHEPQYQEKKVTE